MAVYSEEALSVIGRAQLEAKRLGFPFVQREQLFLGLLHDNQARRILEAIGIDVERAKTEVEGRLLPGLGSPEDPSAIGVLPTAEQVFQHRAQTAAALVGHITVGPEHILLGFLLENHGAVAEALQLLGATKERIIDAIHRTNTQRG